MTTLRGRSKRVVVKLRKERNSSRLFLGDLERAIEVCQGDETVYIIPENDVGLDYLAFASIVFSKVTAMRKPCLNTVVCRRQLVSQFQDLKEETHYEDSVNCADGTAWISIPRTHESRVPNQFTTESYNRFDTVAVGGTFDRLHAGHRLLLTTAAWAAKKTLHIGVTGNALLQHKRHRDLIWSFEERSRCAASYANLVQPDIPRVLVSELTEPMGPTATDPSIGALVVSKETAAGAMKINDIRVVRGMEPMTIIVVNVLDTKDEKLSSSALREIEFMRRYPPAI